MACGSKKLRMNTLIFYDFRLTYIFFIQIIRVLDESPYVIYTGFCVTTCKKRKTILK